MINRKERDDFKNDNLKDTRWLGQVIDNLDPDFEGKIKVRVFGKFDELEDENLPWSYPTNFYTAGSSSGSGFFSIPKINSIVEIVFDNGDIYHPRWRTLHKVSQELKDRIGNEETYENAQVLYYDTESQIYLYHIVNEGLFIRTKSDRVIPEDSEDEEEPPANEILITPEDDIIIRNFNQNEIQLLHTNDIIIQNRTDEDNEININSIILDSENNITITNTPEEDVNNIIRIDNENNITLQNADENIIQISADNLILLEQADGTAIEISADSVSLGTPGGSAEPSVLGDTLEGLLNDMIADLGAVSGIPTPAGPSGPLQSAPNWAPFAQKYKQSFKNFLSKIVTLD